MGFKNKKVIKFVPIDLNEANVQTIFNRCLATEDTDIVISVSLFSKEEHEKVDTPITFDKEEIEKERKNIRYLMGQIKSVHEDLSIMYSTIGTQKYNGEIWTAEPENLMKLLYLARAAGIMSAFGKCLAGLKYIAPTLSPTDPNFAEWYQNAKW